MQKRDLTMTEEFRLEKYLSRLSNPDFHLFRLNEHCLKNKHILKRIFEESKSRQALELKSITPSNIDDYYGMSFIGDVKRYLDWPILTKARPCESRRSSFNIIAFRNNYAAPIEDKIAWSKKTSTAVWRGPLTDTFGRTNSRLLLVKNFCNHKHIDVGLTTAIWSGLIKKDYIKTPLSIEEQFNNKYIISLPGNDICNNLFAFLNSNSVVLMPTPTREGWLLESCLIPWVHFIPINGDMSDLTTKLKWCKLNAKKCKQIVLNANKYVAHFKDEECEYKLQCKVIESYLAKLTFTCSKELKRKFFDLLGNKKNVVSD